jgi:biotin transport system substrate-specific component
LSTVSTIRLSHAGSRVDAAIISRNVLLVLGFAALTAAAAHMRVPVPFSPVPITMQLIPVLLAGAFLGPVRGAASQLTLLGAGMLGMPVFTSGGGPVHLLGATGGYLIGFVGAAWLVGRLIHGPTKLGPVSVVISMMVGAGLIHIFGVTHLAIFLGGDLPTALNLGSLPFLGADLMKAVIGASIFLGWPRRGEHTN